MKVVEFLGRIQAQQNAFARARALYADRLAPEFSPFHFIEPNEVRLSSIIAWMLNPIGSHGQGARFLAAFVKRGFAAWDEDTCGTALVRTEVPTSRLDASRRIDILIQSEDKAIAIENKPWAQDQNKQVSDYLIHLKSEFSGGFTLIYLSGDGSPPTAGSISPDEASMSLSGGQLSVIGYAELIPWIADCKNACRADRVSIFLDDFARYIQQQFLKVRDMTERDQIVSDIISSPAMVASAMQVVFSFEKIKSELIKQLEAHLKDETAKRGWTLIPRIDGPVLWSGFSIRYFPSDETTFTIEFGDKRRANFYYGIRGIGPNHPKYERIHKALTKAFGPGQQGEVWPWNRNPSPTDQLLPLDGDWNTSERPWIAIADRSCVAYIVSAAQQCFDVLSHEKLLAGAVTAT